MALQSENDNIDEIFSILIPINYEDTDAGGVVYYGNYLGFMERARNAYLREHGYPLHVLADQYHLLFVVTDAKLKYLSPALLDDDLRITLKVVKSGGASIIFEHQVLRGDDCLVVAEIKLVTVNKDSLKPCRLPKILTDVLSQHSK